MMHNMSKISRNSENISQTLWLVGKQTYLYMYSYNDRNLLNVYFYNIQHYRSCSSAPASYLAALFLPEDSRRRVSCSATLEGDAPPLCGNLISGLHGNLRWY